MSELDALREENHKLKLALRAVENSLDSLIEENKTLKQSSEEQRAAFESLRIGVLETERRSTEERRKAESSVRELRVKVQSLEGELELKRNELSVSMARNRETQMATEPSARVIQAQLVSEKQLREELSVMRAKSEALEKELGRRRAEVDSLTNQLSAQQKRHESRLAEVEGRAARELEEGRALAERMESEAERAKAEASQKEFQLRRASSEWELNRQFLEAELNRLRSATSGVQGEKDEFFVRHIAELEKEREERRRQRLELDKLRVEKSFVDNELASKRQSFEESERELQSLMKEREVTTHALIEKEQRVAELMQMLSKVETAAMARELALKQKAKEESFELEQQLSRNRIVMEQLKSQILKLQQSQQAQAVSVEEADLRLKKRIKELEDISERNETARNSAEERSKALDIELHKARLERETMNRELQEKSDELIKLRELSTTLSKGLQRPIDAAEDKKFQEEQERKVAKVTQKYLRCKEKLEVANKKLVELLQEKQRGWTQQVSANSPAVQIDQQYASNGNAADRFRSTGQVDVQQLPPEELFIEPQYVTRGRDVRAAASPPVPITADRRRSVPQRPSLGNPSQSQNMNIRIINEGGHLQNDSFEANLQNLRKEVAASMERVPVLKTGGSVEKEEFFSSLRAHPVHSPIIDPFKQVVSRVSPAASPVTGPREIRPVEYAVLDHMSNQEKIQHLINRGNTFFHLNTSS